MADLDDAAELLFFDTFSHEVNSDINLDLVQFPKPVYITQVRIIPLGARVQADFPGGVRLGATNPSKFGIEFFVNDLGMPGASTFENLGSLEYNQNDCIHLECHLEKIPTDGLVLRGWYSTITLAVYGTLTNATVADQIASPPREPSEPPAPEEVLLIPEEEPIKIEKADWRPENLPFEAGAMEVEQFDVVQSPSVGSFQEPDDTVVYKADVRLRKTSHSSDRSGTSRTRTHSESHERDGYTRQKPREWSRSPEYRQSGRRTRSSGGDASHKWPRTPPLDSPIRPRSPDVMESDEFKAKLPADPQPAAEEEEEQFEPILSDDEILGDDDDAQEIEDEIDIEAAIFERAIKIHNPFKTPLDRFDVNLHDLYSKDLENFGLLLNKLKVQTKMDDFHLSSVDEKESLVLISEQLINQLLHFHQTFRRKTFILNAFFHDKPENLQLIGQLLKIALSFECACLQPQPAYKIRHIKTGVRLIELLSPSKDILNQLRIEQNLDPFAQLFALYQQEYMALSIKLMVLKAIYALLDTKEGVQLFINNGKINGYQHLLTNLLQTPLTRTKFALKSIVKKMNLYEALQNIREDVTKQFILADSFNVQLFTEIELAMGEVISALNSDVLSYHQPKRFLPVSKKFEIVYDTAAMKSYTSMIESFFSIHSLCESILLIFSNKSVVPPSLVTKTMDLLEAMMKTHVGIDYFVDDCFEVSQALVSCLLEDPQFVDSEEVIPEEEELDDDELKKGSDLNHFQKLGLALAFRIQTRYHIDAIVYTPLVPEEANFLATHLHELYSQTCSNPSRVHTVETIALNNYLEPIIKLIEKERRQQNSPGVKYKSPVLSYAVDMVDCCVRHCDNLDYLVEHGTTILELAKNHENFEPSVSAVLQEMYVYLKPLESVNIFAYDDITPLVEVITRSLEYITTFPGDLIMGLRILRYQCIGGGKTAASAETTELKHRFMALQFYSADGVMTLLHILEKLCQYFEQPGLHAPALMTIQGVHCCQIVLPTLQVLREMLTFGIQCRDVQYKDLTSIEHLMKTYFLMHYIPGTSQAFEESLKIKAEILKILLAYTQPNEEDEDLLHKSLWTQMIREVIKAILSGPSTFIPGLQVLAELLPLPLPLPITGQLQDSQMQRMLTERKLWSAHLHPESDRLALMIETICPTSFPQLSDLLTRVCLQLADLAPNMTLLVSKTLTEMLCAEGPTGAGLARILNFFAQLTSYASIKSSALSILSGKLWELFQGVLINPEDGITELSSKCQVAVHRILENFFDSEISLISPYSTSLLELNLASALPPRELIPKIIEAILNNLLNAEVTGTVTVAASRNLIILTEHDITFYHLRQALMSKREEFQGWLKKILEINESATFHGLLETIVLLIRGLTHIDNSTTDTTIPNRTLKMTTAELTSLLGYKKDSEEQHILKRIKSILEKVEPPSESLMADIEKNITELETYEPTESDASSPESINEPHLPQTEGIVTQYAARPIFTIYESNDDTQLCVQYWLDPLRIDTLTKEDLALCERVTSDMAELVTTCLPSETNLSSDCKRVLHLSASPQSNRERTPTAPCFRTRRVEVEPTTGRPEKKIYITPVRGRGFARAPPSRGDLFRSRPPNTSRPPSLHVDDFLALETCGAQPTGPTGYNKIPSLMRGSRVGRNRGSRISNAGSGPYRKSKPHRTASPSPWDASLAPPPPQHFRTATSEPVVTPHFSSDPHYSQSHFGGQRSRGRGRIRTYLR
ncbi:protein virilizer isoform X1 [Eupeodes corollae]|uniref:protein virilizer isoform X1 n=1 Tax=Eupeodes corollae TaxID=290404 RepID=UPI002493B312|nr:protein virilizer isoform X1 [Eupeodes corollae]XP_055921645.1 protein virilizer isoform X1 [Eupeodes corollae]